MTLTTAADNLRKARELVALAMADAKDAALLALAEGMPETQVAHALDVDRMTIRKWAGKR